MTSYSPDELLALAIAVSFAAGLNVYAVIAVLGLTAQAGLVTLPAPIAIVGDWWVITISLTLVAIEFMADKIPMIDLVWNALQMFVRVPAGALLAFGATSSLPISLQLIATIAGGGFAFVAAGGKLAMRSAATTSPEPFSNVALGLMEDAVAVGLTWFATQYPWLAAAIALACVVSLVLVLRWMLRGVRAIFRGAGRQIARQDE